MTTSYATRQFGEHAASASHALVTFLGRHWSALKERRERARVRAILYGMPDRELKDLGLTRNEIESVMVYDSGERVRAYPKQNRFRG
jgi:uncharacterized protein YjiS (DUF1127 family)